MHRGLPPELRSELWRESAELFMSRPMAAAAANSATRPAASASLLPPPPSMPSTSVSREIEVDRLSAQLWLPRRALMAWDAGSGRGTHGRDQAVGGRALHRAATSDQAHGRPLDHRRSPPALHQRRPAARNHLACRRPPPAALDRYLVHLPSYARRMPRCTRSACAWRMRPTPERARCAAPDSYARRLSAFRWQDAACMERRCRLSAVQPEQALGYVHTWHQRLC